MFRHQKIEKLDDFFKSLSQRRSGQDIYFYRINAYTQEIEQFIRRYYEEARRCGVVIEGKIPNPDERNLSYYEEMMGMDFQLSPEFISTSLEKWLPRMKMQPRKNVTESLYDSLFSLKREGKNENMLRNAYIKFMCWLYYKFERIVNLLGEEQIPKILYEGEISRYELMLISILANAGCDVVLLQYHGDQKYLQLDAGSLLSDDLQQKCLQHREETWEAFPETFSLKWMREQKQKEAETERLYGKKPEVKNCTNAWISGKGLEDVEQPVSDRGNDPGFFYNCFLSVNGVKDKLTYVNELYQFSQKLKTYERPVVVIDREIPQPSTEEIAAIRRKNYTDSQQMLLDLSSNIRYARDAQLQSLMVKAFIDVMLKEAEEAQMSINRLTGKAIYLLCWLKRYQPHLFPGWKMPQVSCLIHMGECVSEAECLFLRLLARLPVDVVIFNPQKEQKIKLQDKLLYEIHYEDSLPLMEFPQENGEVKMATAAYHAERELDTLLYQDSGFYREKQYQKAVSVNLQTMYEEIWILWKEELKYRPNFSTSGNKVNMPVIFAKVSGVKDASVPIYWEKVKELLTEDTVLISKVPFTDSVQENPMKEPAVGFYKNHRLLRDKIKSHPAYPYGFLREEIQEHILDKLQFLIEDALIKGTFETGVEYTIIATVLNLPKEILRLIQKFDFTKKNPKVVYINTGEKIISLEDSILMAFLNFVGFDVIFFIPTGYQNIEKYFNRKVIEEHQAGEYLYDLPVPDFDRLPASAKPKTWIEKLFRGGV